MKNYNFSDHWWETLFILLFIIGLIFSFFIDVTFFDVLILFIAGVLFARLIVPYKAKWRFPFVTLGLGFVVGYLIATKHRIWIFLFFVLGVVLTRIFDLFREQKR